MYPVNNSHSFTMVPDIIEAHKNEASPMDRQMSSIINSTFILNHNEEEMAQRISKYTRANRYLSQLTDENLSKLLATATPLGCGIGGETLSLEVEGVPLFIKKIRMTDIERQYPGSTRNIFELPSYYQYGVGSMGFGVQREIASHEMTTEWVLNGECQNFPLMYHSRALKRSTFPQESSIEELQKKMEDGKGYVAYWDGSSAVGMRSAAVDTASCDVVVFMEHLPKTLYRWFCEANEQGNLTEQSLTKLEQELNAVAAFMKSKGFLHFDAHFHNILAINDHIYFADFGLAMSDKFELSSEEQAFFEKHIDYDRYYVVKELVKNAIAASVPENDRKNVLDTYFSDKLMTTTLPPAVATIAERYRPIAILMDTFFNGLQNKSKSTPYPEAELSLEWSKH